MVVAGEIIPGDGEVIEVESEEVEETNPAETADEDETIIEE